MGTRAITSNRRAGTERQHASTRPDTLEDERATYARQLDSLDAQMGRLAQLFAAGLFHMDEIAAQKAQLDAAKTSCQKEIARVDGLLVGMRSVTDRVDELTALVQRVRAKVDAGLTDETKRTIIDLLDLRVKIDVDEAGNKYADVVCQLTLDEARLLVAGVDNSSVTTTDRRSFEAP